MAFLLAFPHLLLMASCDTTVPTGYLRRTGEVFRCAAWLGYRSLPVSLRPEVGLLVDELRRPDRWPVGR